MNLQLPLVKLSPLTKAHWQDLIAVMGFVCQTLFLKDIQIKLIIMINIILKKQYNLKLLIYLLSLSSILGAYILYLL